VRRTERGAVVARLPLGESEEILLEDDRRVLLATGGPERKHKFVILIYTSAAPPVAETAYAAYRRKFRLQNGYPTYACSARDVSVEEQDGEKLLRVVVPFAEAGERSGDPPEVRLSTPQAARYEEAIAGTPG